MDNKQLLISSTSDLEKYNQKRYSKSVELARLARELIISENIADIKESVFLEYTIKVDVEGKGLGHSTIYKNEDVHKIFVSLNHICQERLAQIHKTKRKQKKQHHLQDMDALYNGLKRCELINIIEEQKQKIIYLDDRLANSIAKQHQFEEQNKKQLLYILELQSNNKPFEIGSNEEKY
jgi:hypothetical protein